jgi:hypothetical protein
MLIVIIEKKHNVDRGTTANYYLENKAIKLNKCKTKELVKNK